MLSRMLPVLVLASCASAWAQSSHGYVFVAPGAVSGSGSSAKTLHIGGGGEGVIWKGATVGAEIGVLGLTDYFNDSVSGAASFNGGYHFRRGRAYRLDPFVTAGYTLFFRNGTANLYNFGGGVNYWVSRHVGLKLEFRDHVWPGHHANEHWLGFRLGVAFRGGE